MTEAVVRRLQVWTEPKILDREAQRWLPGETFVALEKKIALWELISKQQI